MTPVEKRGSAVTIGAYDGVHLGHRALIELVRREADKRGLDSVVVTFDRHPAAVVRPEQTPKLLTGLDHKLELLHDTGVDRVHVLHFDTERASESALDFVSSLLVGELNAKLIVVGANFRFGHRQGGDVALLKEVGPSFDFDVIDLPLVSDAQAALSATRIRALISGAHLEDAAQLLGRPHELRGVLTELSGAREGELGLIVDAQLCVPPSGRYVALVKAPKIAPIEATVRVLKDEDPTATVAIEGASIANASGSEAALLLMRAVSPHGTSDDER